MLSIVRSGTHEPQPQARQQAWSLQSGSGGPVVAAGVGKARRPKAPAHLGRARHRRRFLSPFATARAGSRGMLKAERIDLWLFLTASMRARGTKTEAGGPPAGVFRPRAAPLHPSHKASAGQAPPNFHHHLGIPMSRSPRHRSSVS